jgi:hypothetical protein
MLKALWKHKPLDDSGKKCLDLVVSQLDEFHKEFIA